VAEKVLTNFSAFEIDGSVTILIDDDTVAVLNGFDNFLMAHDLQKGLGAGKYGR
jgi:hypothetical protein